MAIAVPARRFASLVKIEHTVFALPYAYVGAILAVSGWPGLRGMLWITVAMAGARSFAMAANRLIDAAIDARNPRTASRELPAGLLSRAQVVVFALASLALFLIAVWQLDPITHWLWPFVIVPMVIYPYLKRFTPLCLWGGWPGHSGPGPAEPGSARQPQLRLPGGAQGEHEQQMAQPPQPGNPSWPVLPGGLVSVRGHLDGAIAAVIQGIRTASAAHRRITPTWKHGNAGADARS